MILYLDARTTVKDLIIDYIEVELANGETASLNWDESEIERTGNGFSARYKGVCFGEVYANGRLVQRSFNKYHIKQMLHQPLIFHSFYISSGKQQVLC